MRRFVWPVAIALLAAACGGGGAVPTATPGSQVTLPPGATATPGGAPTAQPNTGDNRSKAQALIPPGASTMNEITVGNSYTVQVTSAMTLDQLGAFWTTAIPAAGLTESGRYSASGSLIIAFTNPDGGVTATVTDTGVLISISVGTSS